MKWMRPLGNMVIPSALFYITYNVISIIPAVLFSLAYSVISVVYTKMKSGVIKNSQIVGAIGLAASAAAMIFTGEEKLYYVPKLVENAIFLGFMIVLSGRHRSVLHYLAKDFEIASLQEIPESSMLSVNIVWMVYFALKIISKIAGFCIWILISFTGWYSSLVIR